SFTQASDFLQRAVGEAQVKAALIIGGDPDHPVGPFPDSFDLLASGLIERHGLREVAFAGYPEGHPRIAARTLGEALRAKVALARILAEAGPDVLVDALAAGEDPSSRIDGLHVFTFGGIRRTAEWIRARGGLSWRDGRR